jgi:hypothetical protein
MGLLAVKVNVCVALNANPNCYLLFTRDFLRLDASSLS